MKTTKNDALERAKFAAASNGPTIETRQKFLAAYALTGNLSEGARVAGISRNTVYDLARADRSFRKQMRDARAAAADALEAEARRRAVDGWDDPVFFMGNEVGSVRKYSDTLLVLLLKAAKRNKFRDRTEVSGDPRRPLKTEAVMHVYIPDNGRSLALPPAKEDEEK